MGERGGYFGQRVGGNYLHGGNTSSPCCLGGISDYKNPSPYYYHLHLRLELSEKCISQGPGNQFVTGLVYFQFKIPASRCSMALQLDSQSFASTKFVSLALCFSSGSQQSMFSSISGVRSWDHGCLVEREVRALVGPVVSYNLVDSPKCPWINLL